MFYCSIYCFIDSRLENIDLVVCYLFIHEVMGMKMILVIVCIFPVPGVVGVTNSKYNEFICDDAQLFHVIPFFVALFFLVSGWKIIFKILNRSRIFMTLEYCTWPVYCTCNSSLSMFDMVRSVVTSIMFSIQFSMVVTPIKILEWEDVSVNHKTPSSLYC